jgi:hypothetical protein
MSTAPSPSPSLSIEIGTAERALRRLLDERIAPAGLSFPEWTTLTFVRNDGPVAVAAVVERQVAGGVESAPAAQATVAGLQRRGYLSPEPLTLTAAGEALYGPLAQGVAGVGRSLWGDLPADEIETARRVLVEVTQRARRRLAA